MAPRTDVKLADVEMQVELVAASALAIVGTVNPSCWDHGTFLVK